MDDVTRRDERKDEERQRATATDEREQEDQDQLSERRKQTYQRPPLTRREQEDRWPIG